MCWISVPKPSSLLHIPSFGSNWLLKEGRPDFFLKKNRYDLQNLMKCKGEYKDKCLGLEPKKRIGDSCYLTKAKVFEVILFAADCWQETNDIGISILSLVILSQQAKKVANPKDHLSLIEILIDYISIILVYFLKLNYHNLENTVKHYILFVDFNL